MWIISHLVLGTQSVPLSVLDFLTAHCSLLTAHCSLLTAHCSLLTAHCSLLTAHCSLLTAPCPLPTAHCSLLTARCTSPFALPSRAAAFSRSSRYRRIHSTRRKLPIPSRPSSLNL